MHKQAVHLYSYDSFMLFVAAILFVCNTILNSRYQLIYFGAASQQYFLAVSILVVVFFALIAFIEKDLSVLLLTLVILIYLAANLIYFSLHTNRPLNFNTLGQYTGSLSAVVFYVLIKRGLLSRAMILLFFVYLIYLASYCNNVIFNFEDIFYRTISQQVTVTMSDIERGSRLFIYGPAAWYVLFFAISKLKEKLSVVYLFSIAVAAAAIGLSLSRSFIIISCLIPLLYLLTGSLKIMRDVALMIFLAVSVYMMIGIIDPSMNPFSYDAADTSTIARRYEYYVLVQYIWKYPFFGIGLPDSIQGLVAYLGSEVDPSDIGTIGTWALFGVVGFVLIGLLPVYVCLFQNIAVSNTNIGVVETRTLVLLGACIAIYQLIAGAVGGQPAAPLIFSLILGNTIYNIVYGRRMPVAKGNAVVQRLKMAASGR